MILKAIVALLFSCSVAMAGQGMGPGPGVKGYASGGGVTAEDTFNRTNADALGSLSGGAYSWSEVEGDIDIYGNKALSAAATGKSIAVLSSAISSSSGTIVFKVNAEDLTWGVSGIVFSYVDTNNYITARIMPSSDTANLQVIRTASGTENPMSEVDANLALNTEYTLTVRYTATTIQVDVAGIGTNLINLSGQTIAAGNVGMFFDRSGDPLGTIDDWSYTP